MAKASAICERVEISRGYTADRLDLLLKKLGRELEESQKRYTRIPMLTLSYLNIH